MGIISVEQADHLYWLGRYAERVYTTLILYSKNYDTLIDGTGDSYIQFCNSIDIPNIYGDKYEFTTKYPFDKNNVDSIISNLNRAYDNAIILRESIGSETLAYIQLAVYAMNKAAQSQCPMIELQQVTDNIIAFYGMVDDQIDSENIRNIIKTGKRIERIDMYARLGAKKEVISREIKRLVPRIQGSGLEYDKSKLESIIEMGDSADNNHYAIVSAVESIL